MQATLTKAPPVTSPPPKISRIVAIHSSIHHYLQSVDFVQTLHKVEQIRPRRCDDGKGLLQAPERHVPPLIAVRRCNSAAVPCSASATRVDE